MTSWPPRSSIALVHHCHLVTIRGNSYRMRQHTELWQTLQPDVDDAEPVRRTRKSKRQVTETIMVCNFQPPELRNFRPALTERGWIGDEMRGLVVRGPSLKSRSLPDFAQARACGLLDIPPKLPPRWPCYPRFWRAFLDFNSAASAPASVGNSCLWPSMR